MVRRAFLSSTGADLKAYREAAHKAIDALDDWKCIWMEDFGARNWDVDSFCRTRVAECDLFIAIVGHRFGGAPPNSKQSYTQREYFAASETEKPILLFIAPDDFPIAANLIEPQWKIKAQQKFRQALRRSGAKLPAIPFESPDKLAVQVVQAIYHWVAEQPQPETAAKRRPAEDPTRYLEALHADTRYIDVPGFQLGQKEAYRFPITELYTPLTTVLMPAEKSARPPKDRKAAEPREQKPVPLQEALRYSPIVIVGDPGAGKTTFLHRIAFAACETLLGRDPTAVGELLKTPGRPFPVMIPLSRLAEFIQQKRRPAGAASEYPTDLDSPDWLFHYLGAISRERGWGLGADFFRGKLGQKDGALLLLDALDEAPDRLARKSLLRLVELAGQRFGQARIVVTSRPPAYGGEDVIPGFTTVQIGPLQDEAIDTFLANWCRLLYPESDESAAKHGEQLQAEIHSRPEILDMAVNPVMLTALAVVHWNDKHLPDQRAELYEAVLRWLARRREERIEQVRAERCLDLMAQLAYAMHTERTGKKVEIAPYAAARAIAPRFRELPEEEKIPAAEQLLGEEELHSGIIVRRGDLLKFWHQTFQEYLSARAVAGKQAEWRRLLIEEQKAYLPEWRETLLLLAGVLHSQSPDRVDALVKLILDELRDPVRLRDCARAVGLVGAILQDLRAVNYRVSDPRYEANLRRALGVFDRDAVREVEFDIRLAAAEAIGQAGDPRLKADNWVRVEGDAFWMGAQKENPKGRNFDPEAHDDVAPVHQAQVYPFLLARYPAMVEEFAGFVDAGGYRDEKHWRLGGYGRYPEPDNWRAQLRHPSRPVVSVSWYEAAAYCHWAGCRLPTEAEWEFSARNGAAATRYPWPDGEPDEAKANFAMRPGHPTPVGLYPAGATRSGLEDMAGNVWEWVADWYGKYPAQASTNPPGPPKGTSKVLRGGSWYIGPGYLRSSGRSLGVPEGRVDNIGFRCARDV